MILLCYHGVGPGSFSGGQATLPWPKISWPICCSLLTFTIRLAIRSGLDIAPADFQKSMVLGWPNLADECLHRLRSSVNPPIVDAYQLGHGVRCGPVKLQPFQNPLCHLLTDFPVAQGVPDAIPSWAGAASTACTVCSQTS